MTFAPVDEELATLFAVCWDSKLKHLPSHERLPATMAIIRGVLARDQRAAGDARTTLRPVGRARIAIQLSIKKAREMRPVVERIVGAHGQDYRDVCGASKCREVLDPRHEAIWVLHREFGLTKTMAGFCVGRRDHSCAINSIRIVDALVAADPSLGLQLRAIARGDARAHLRALPGRAA